MTASCLNLSSQNDLPFVKGKYHFNYSLSQITWFKVGGVCDVFFKPYDVDDLCTFLKNKPSHIPITVLGAASNVLIRDGGVDGCVIKLSAGFSNIFFHEEDNKKSVYVGAACLDRSLALACVEKGYTGLEFFISIPGTIGGAIAMNAGAYGFEVKDVLEYIDVVTYEGELKRIDAQDLKMSYRKGNLPQGVIVVGASFLIKQAEKAIIQEKIDTYLKHREDSQPTKGRTGGSTFKNPVEGYKAWELIDKAGFRGYAINDAQVSQKHCNFLLNSNKATAKDLEDLGELIRKTVYEKFDYTLEWEVIRIGKFA